MRACSPALALVLASPGIPLWRANMFTFDLANGDTYYWTDWDTDLDFGGNTYVSKKPWLKRGSWGCENSMVASTMDLTLMALNDGFAGGPSIKAQIHNGLFDGAWVTVVEVFMPAPGDVTTLGGVEIFAGNVGGIDMDGGQALITVKGLANLLDRNVPVNIISAGCIHTFCDPNCTLLAASFTFDYVVDSGASRIFIPWTSPPSNPEDYQGGTVRIVNGPAAGQSRTVRTADASGLTLTYPLYNTPEAGDDFTAFEGCDKTKTRCTDLGNEQNFRGFPWVPPVEYGY